MSNKSDNKVREFYIESDFQKKARRPGGISRDQALSRAGANIDAFKENFTTWLDEQLSEFFGLIPDQGTAEFKKLGWIDAAGVCSQRLADVAATMDYQFVSFVANNLCLIFEAINRGAEHNSEIIACHIDALRLARQQQYRGMRPADLPELSEGLRQVLNSPSLQPRLDDGGK
jgi:hypothetical protein